MVFHQIGDAEMSVSTFGKEMFVDSVDVDQWVAWRKTEGEESVA